jgi:hypothetical protein
VAACRVGRRWAKKWGFTSNRAEVEQMHRPCLCNGNHQQVAGVRLADGSYLTAATAEYPNELVDLYVEVWSPLLPGEGPSHFVNWDLEWCEEVATSGSIKELAVQDGAGIISSAFCDPDQLQQYYGPSNNMDPLRQVRESLEAHCQEPLKDLPGRSPRKREPNMFSKSDWAHFEHVWGAFGARFGHVLRPTSARALELLSRLSESSLEELIAPCFVK